MGLTPMMRQYFEIKEQYPDALLFFRLGDFYEMFFDDAKLASRELEITLTGRDCGLAERAPMCGVPHHSAESYISRLIEKGYKVAICEQVTDPSEANGLVERQVVRIVTPGTVMEASMLEEKSNHYIASLLQSGDSYGLAFCDVSTGEFLLTEIAQEDGAALLLDELSRLGPKELIVNTGMQMQEKLMCEIKECLGVYISVYQDWAYAHANARDCLTRHFKVQSLSGYGCEEMEYAVGAAGALLSYLSETQKNALTHIRALRTYHPQSYMVLDSSTRRNLELTESLHSQERKGSLLWLIDRTGTAMGGRMLKKWVQQPLVDKPGIEARLDAVGELIEREEVLSLLSESLKAVYDLERLMGRIAYGTANGRDLVALKASLTQVPPIHGLVKEMNAALFHIYDGMIDDLTDMADLIEDSIREDCPLTIREGGIIKEGWNGELDAYRRAMGEGKQWIAELEKKERERTGIKNLKVGYNKVFGYYLDVTKSNFDLVPDDYVRKQTLANSERYITQELKEMEDTILGAEEKSLRLEYRLFTDIREQINAEVGRIQSTAEALASLDALASLANVSRRNGYVRPGIRTDGLLCIKAGRHPVVERTLPHQQFVPNDTRLNLDESRFMILTGPNMAGKSTYMRQVALITLLAQIGCFVPADEAEVGIVDRIFTRVGASDDLASGQSTFMVEMNEVSNILHHATRRSLLVLDEIGRGTSTYDGLSIAWAVVEHICQDKALGCRTLFATHYHELTELEGKIEGVKNYSITVQEHGEDIIFLRRIVRGGTQKSLGIQVARLAGLPDEVIARAKELLGLLENADISSIAEDREAAAARQDTGQITFFEDKAPVDEKRRHFVDQLIKEFAGMDINSMTPIEALGILDRWAQKARRVKG